MMHGEFVAGLALGLSSLLVLIPKRKETKTVAPVVPVLNLAVSHSDENHAVLFNGVVEYNGPDEAHARRVEAQLLEREGANAVDVLRFIDGLHQPRSA